MSCCKISFHRNYIGMRNFFIKLKLYRKREIYYEINEISAFEK